MTAPDRRLSDAEIELLIERAAARAAQTAVETAFRSLGVDITDPVALRAWHADQGWTRSAREGAGRLGLSIKTTVVGTITTAIGYLIWATIQSGGPPP